MRNPYSHSRISCFENCPRQFEFRYILELPREIEGIEAFVGKLVHEILERFYLKLAEDLMPSKASVLYRYRLLWDERYAKKQHQITIVKKENSPQFYQELGARCLSNYYQRNYPFDHGETLSVEKKFLFHLDEKKEYPMQAIIDRVTRANDGTLEIHDYKTGARVLNQKQSDTDRQLALYQCAATPHYEHNGQVRLIWHYLQSNQVRKSERTPEELDQLKKETRSTIDQIESTSEFKAKPSTLCRWCEYNRICPESPSYDKVEEATVMKEHEATLNRVSASSA